MQLTLQHSKTGSRKSSVKIDPGYLSYVVRLLSFPREYRSPENQRAELLVADELMRTFFTCERIGKTRNVVLAGQRRHES